MSKSRFLDLKRFGLEGGAGQRELEAGFGRFAFDNEFLHRAKKSSELGSVANWKEIPQHSRIVIAKKNRALIRKFDCVKNAEMIPKRSQSSGADNESAPMCSP